MLNRREQGLSEKFLKDRSGGIARRTSGTGKNGFGFISERGPISFRNIVVNSVSVIVRRSSRRGKCNGYG